MKELTINTTGGIIRAVQYCEENGIEKDLAILYLTILLNNHSKEERLEPFPIWMFGLSDIKRYLGFFKRFNLIDKSGNDYSVSDFIKNDIDFYSIYNPETINSVVDSSIETTELSSYFNAF
jgi:hypothetical protein